MNNFEERYTAWLDGALDERERAAFEAELPDPAAARREAEAWRHLRGDLRAVVPRSAMPHADFVNAQVLAAIARTSPVPPGRDRSVGWLNATRLAWVGAFLLALTALVSALVLPRNGGRPDHDAFVSQVIEAHTADPRLGAHAFAAPGGGAVLWVNDAGYIPPDVKLK